LGQLESAAGNLDRAREVLQDALALDRAHGKMLGAARLAGAAAGIRERAAMPIPAHDAALLERFLAPARATISRDVWDAELAAGRALTLQQTVTLLVPSAPST
jgi:hypothetical protein